MHARQRIDASFDGVHIGLDLVGAGEAHDRLRQRQRILGAMIDFPCQQVLPFLGALAFGDVHGDAADAHDAAAVVHRRRRRADAPADLSIGPDNTELGLIGPCALVELGDRLAQLIDVIGMQQRLDVGRVDLEALGADAKDAILPLVPHPVAADPIPVPGAHLAGGDRHAAPLLALAQLRGGILQFRRACADAVLEILIQPFELAGLAIEPRRTPSPSRAAPPARPAPAHSRPRPSRSRATGRCR